MNLSHRINQIKYHFNRYGFWKTVFKCIKRLLRIKDKEPFTDNEAYQMWMGNNELDTDLELENIKKEKFKNMPLISIVVPMYNTNERYFEELVESVISQTYPYFELCLADGSTERNKELEEIAKKDNRIFYKYLGENKGISGNTNETLKLTNGEYIVLLDHDDLLPQTALYEIVKTINENPDVDFMYSDEDKINDAGERFDPYFKPDFSPETLDVHNYITHLVCFKKELQEEVGFFDNRFDGAQDFDMILRLTEKAQKIVHIPKILYHWRTGQNSTASAVENKLYAYEAGKRVIEERLKRLGRSGTVLDSKEVPGIYRIQYDVIGNPKVSILIPNKDGIEFLKPCIESILKLTTYNNYEIVVIENNSENEATFKYYEKIKSNPKVKVLYYDEKEFNYSRIINFGVKNVDGDFVVQLNNDTKLISKDWLETFIGYCQFKEIGACGARLYYKDKSIQHAGIAVGIQGTAGNLLVNLEHGKHAYYGYEALTRNVSAVTGACLFARREIYEEVGFMEDKLFKVAFNDVDFCLKILEKGYRIVYNPFVEFYHYESKTRGLDELDINKKARFDKEAEDFKRKWKDVLVKPDKYYNRNFSRHRVDFYVETEEIKY